jgi:hypothetical protein
MKGILIILVLALAILSGNAFAEDYSHYTTEELANMRGILQDASQEERDAFKAEWLRRLQNMTSKEKQKYTGRPNNAQCQTGAGKMQGRRNVQGEGGCGKGMGRGSGGGFGKGMGECTKSIFCQK